MLSVYGYDTDIVDLPMDQALDWLQTLDLFNNYWSHSPSLCFCLCRICDMYGWDRSSSCTFRSPTRQFSLLCSGF